MDMLALRRLAFHTGELAALLAADESAIFDVVVDGDEIAAPGDVAEDRIVRRELVYGLI